MTQASCRSRLMQKIVGLCPCLLIKNLPLRRAGVAGVYCSCHHSFSDGYLAIARLVNARPTSTCPSS